MFPSTNAEVPWVPSFAISLSDESENLSKAKQWIMQNIQLEYFLLGFGRHFEIQQLNKKELELVSLINKFGRMEIQGWNSGFNLFIVIKLLLALIIDNFGCMLISVY